MFDYSTVTALEDAIDKSAVSEQMLDVARLHRSADRLEGMRLREIGRAARDGQLVELHHSPDCPLYRVLTHGPSTVIDVARALVAGGRGCTEPGCNAPPGWCDVHHDKHWADGGETNLANCRLECWRHHHDDHEGAGGRGP